jgi:hypothetical protein
MSGIGSGNGNGSTTSHSEHQAEDRVKICFMKSGSVATIVEIPREYSRRGIFYSHYLNTTEEVKKLGIKSKISDHHFVILFSSTQSRYNFNKAATEFINAHSGRSMKISRDMIIVSATVTGDVYDFPVDAVSAFQRFVVVPSDHYEIIRRVFTFCTLCRKNDQCSCEGFIECNDGLRVLSKDYESYPNQLAVYLKPSYQYPCLSVTDFFFVDGGV